MRIGLDIGYSSVKLVYGTKMSPEVVRLPIGAAPMDQCVVDHNGASATGAGHEVFINNEQWIAGISPVKLEGFNSVMDDDYPTTDQYRALFYAALSEVGATEIDALVTGLPVDHFRDTRVRDSLLKLMKGRHYIRKDLTVDVKNVQIIPQPAGAFGAYTLDAMTGGAEVTLESDMAVLVVDPGHFSLDWVIYNGGFKLGSSGSTSDAGEVVVRKAAAKLTETVGVTVHASKLQDAVLSGAKPLRVGAKLIDFWPAIQDEARAIVRSNLTTLKGSIRSVSRKRGVDVVLVTGGGASLFKDALAEAFPESVVLAMRDPVTANARGFYNFALQAK